MKPEFQQRQNSACIFFPASERRRMEEKDKPGASKEDSDDTVLKIDATGREFDAALFGETVQTGFSKMYNDPLLSDITLLLGSERIPAHRMVLCAWSETFKSMLSQEWRESHLRELPIQVEEEDHEHFKNMLKYMYTGDVTFVKGANVINLIRFHFRPCPCIAFGPPLPQSSSSPFLLPSPSPCFGFLSFARTISFLQSKALTPFSKTFRLLRYSVVEGGMIFFSNKTNCS